MRPDGFGRIADVATDLMDDDRVLDAVDAVGLGALSAYLSVVLGSWARGERLTLAQVARRSPAGWGLLDALPELLPALGAVGLLDADGRIPDATWASWYGPARDRYAQRVEASAKGVAARAAKRAGSPPGSPPGSPNGQPSRSTLPSVRPSVVLPNGRTDDGDVPAPVNGRARNVVVADDGRPRRPWNTSWAGKPCPDPVDHGWTHVMTNAGLVCRTCTPLGAGDAA